MLPIGYVKHKSLRKSKPDEDPMVKACELVKRHPSEVYTRYDDVVRLKPPVYSLTTIDEFNDLLWEHHGDLMNRWDWNQSVEFTQAFRNHRHPTKFKYRTCKVVDTWNGAFYDRVFTLSPWTEVKFKAVIMPNFRHSADEYVVPDEDPQPPRLYEGMGQPSNNLGFSGDFYFDLATRTEARNARLYGPKLPQPNDKDNPVKRSQGKWTLDPLPELVNIDMTWDDPKFKKYRSTLAQIFSDLPVSEYMDVIAGNIINTTFVGTYYDERITGAATDSLWIPRWPTIEGSSYGAMPTGAYGEAIEVVKQTHYNRLVLFDPETTSGIYGVWNPASNEPVWGTDFLSGLAHPHATTFRDGDFRNNVFTVHTGNQPWPADDRTTSARPTFGVWTPGQTLPIIPLKSPVFNHAMLNLPSAFCPIGGRIATEPSGAHDYFDEQINPVPIDPFYFDYAHPDGEYSGDPGSFPGWNGSNMHFCNGTTFTFVPAFPSNHTRTNYMIQSTMILD